MHSPLFKNTPWWPLVATYASHIFLLNRFNVH